MDREKEHKKQKVGVIVAGSQMTSAALALLSLGLAGSIRAEPVINTRDMPDDLFFDDRRPTFETAQDAYMREMREESDRQRPIVEASEAKRKRKAEKRARDWERMQKK